MEPTLALVLVLVLSVGLSRGLKNIASRGVILSGAEYLAVGLVLGPYVLDLASGETLDLLQPVLSLLVGLLGFNLGLSLRRTLGLQSDLWAGLAAPLVTVAVVAGGLLALGVSPTLEGQAGAGLWAALTLGAIAAVTAVEVLATGARLFDGRGPSSAPCNASRPCPTPPRSSSSASPWRPPARRGPAADPSI